jgi:hypothetical protein
MLTVTAFLILMALDFMPLYGVLVLDWHLGQMLLTYSLEGTLIGCFVLLRAIVFCRRNRIQGGQVLKTVSALTSLPVMIIFTAYLLFIEPLFPDDIYKNTVLTFHDYFLGSFDFWTPWHFLDPEFLPVLLPNFKWIIAGIVGTQTLSLISFAQTPLDNLPRLKSVSETTRFLLSPFLQYMLLVQVPVVAMAFITTFEDPNWTSLFAIIIVKTVADFCVFLRSKYADKPTLFGHFHKMNTTKITKYD